MRKHSFGEDLNWKSDYRQRTLLIQLRFVANREFRTIYAGQPYCENKSVLFSVKIQK